MISFAGRGLPEALKKMLMAVSESEKENPPLWGMGVVAMAVLVQFVYSLVQKELSVMVISTYSEATPALITFLLACAQVAAAVVVFQVSNLHITTSSMNREAAIIGILAYAGGLFLNNYMLWTEESAASACYAVQEPVVCIMLLYAAACISTDMNRTGVVVCLCVGAALLTVNFTLLLDTSALLHILASLFLLVRNVVTKHMYDSNVSFILRKQNCILTVVACGTVVIALVGFMVSQALLIPSLLVIVTAVLSVTLLHLQITMLSLYDTLTVAVFTLWAQVLHNVIFMADSDRPGFISIVIGAVMFAASNYAYFKDGLESGTVHLNIKQVGVNELLTRLQFILYTGSIVGLTVTLLQPFVSERDLKILSYVGLDRIARKLLNVHPAEH